MLKGEVWDDSDDDGIRDDGVDEVGSRSLAYSVI